MTPQDPYDACRYSTMAPGHRRISLTAPRGGWPKGFPRGELLNEMERNGVLEQTRSIDTAKIVKWMQKNCNLSNS